MARLTPPPLAPLASLRWAVVESWVSTLRPRRVLEIGCGLGGFGSRLASMSEYVGVEADPISAAAAETAVGDQGRVICGSLDELLDGLGTFDLVLAFEVLEHQEDDRHCLSGWVKAVSEGGHLMLSVPADPSRFGAWDEQVGHFRRYSADGLRHLMNDVGLSDIHCQHYGWPLGYLTEPIRNQIAARRQNRNSTPSMNERTSSSGRQFQPQGARLGAAINLATAPFVYSQKLRPGTGTGLVAIGCLRS